MKPSNIKFNSRPFASRDLYVQLQYWHLGMGLKDIPDYHKSYLDNGHSHWSWVSPARLWRSGHKEATGPTSVSIQIARIHLRNSCHLRSLSYPSQPWCPLTIGSPLIYHYSKVVKYQLMAFYFWMPVLLTTITLLSFVNWMRP